jgi:hypothetical protein
VVGVEMLLVMPAVIVLGIAGTLLHCNDHGAWEGGCRSRAVAPAANPLGIAHGEVPPNIATAEHLTSPLPPEVWHGPDGARSEVVYGMATKADA